MVERNLPGERPVVRVLKLVLLSHAKLERDRILGSEALARGNASRHHEAKRVRASAEAHGRLLSFVFVPEGEERNIVRSTISRVSTGRQFRSSVTVTMPS